MYSLYLLQFCLFFFNDFFCLFCGDFYFLNWENFISNYRKFIKNALKYFLFQMTRSWIKSCSEVSFTAWESLPKRDKQLRAPWCFICWVFFVFDDWFFFNFFLKWLQMEVLLYPSFTRLMIRALAHKRCWKTSACFKTCIWVSAPSWHKKPVCVIWSNHRQWAIIAKEKDLWGPSKHSRRYFASGVIQDLKMKELYDSVSVSEGNFIHVFLSVSGPLVWGTYTCRKL